MQAIILASGLNTRVRHVFPDLPKAMFPAAGKPFLHWYLDHTFNNGVTSAIVIVEYQRDKIEAFIKNYVAETGRDIKTFTRKETDGPVGAVVDLDRNGLLDSEFLLLYGDMLFSADFNTLRNHFVRRPARLGITFVTQDPHELFADMEIMLDEHSETVSEFNPHAFKRGEGWFDVGQLYHRDAIIPLLQKRPPEEEHINANIWPDLISKRQLGYHKVGAVLDVGTEANYKKTVSLLERHGLSSI